MYMCSIFSGAGSRWRGWVGGGGWGGGGGPLAGGAFRGSARFWGGFGAAGWVSWCGGCGWALEPQGLCNLLNWAARGGRVVRGWVGLVVIVFYFFLRGQGGGWGWRVGGSGVVVIAGNIFLTELSLEQLLSLRQLIL